MAGFGGKGKNDILPPDSGMQPDTGQPNYYDPSLNQAPPDPMANQYPGGNYPDPNQQQFPGQGSQGQPNQQQETESFEEIAEAIINEKWNELIKDINKVIEWKERTDTQIKRIEQEIINLKERFESLHRGVLGKITAYDQNLTNVGTEIKAMEMAFKKILPSFTENVNKLERITKQR